MRAALLLSLHQDSLARGDCSLKAYRRTFIEVDPFFRCARGDLCRLRERNREGGSDAALAQGRGVGARSGGQKIVISLQRAKHLEPHAETACDATRARGDVKSPGPKRTFSLYSANIPGHSVAQYLRSERFGIVFMNKEACNVIVKDRD